MTQEEKAKAYDEAYKRATIRFGSNVADELFPEFNESEDERIRTAIIHFISHTPTVPKGIIGKETMLAWLEKQSCQKSIDELTPQEAMDVAVAKYFNKSEQNLTNEMKSAEESLGISSEEYNKIVDDCIYGKHTDKIKPKFKIGDFIVNDYCMGRIVEITNDAYLLDTEQGIPLSYEHNAHLWTIQDAKDGDVLFHSDSASNGIFIFKEIIDRGFAKEIICYCDYDSEDHFCLGEHHTCCWTNAKILHPATKEQRNLLFSKMKEAGYEWDAEKKELKKIDNEEVNGEDYGIDGLWHAQRILENTLGNVYGYQTDDGILDHKAAITAVKKLYKQKPTWSEDDEGYMDRILEALYDYYPKRYAQSIYDWLKFLKKSMKGE